MTRIEFLKNALIVKGYVWRDGPNVGSLKQRDVRAALREKGIDVEPWTLYRWFYGTTEIPFDATVALVALAGVTLDEYASKASTIVAPPVKHPDRRPVPAKKDGRRKGGSR